MPELSRQLNVMVAPTMYRALLEMSQQTGLSQGAIVRQALQTITAKSSQQKAA